MKEKTFKVKRVFTGRIFNIDRHHVRLSGGRETVREIIKHPGAIAVIPILDDGRIVMIKQFRKAVEKELYEITAGTLEKGENLKECVKRELLEETGYTAKKIEHMISFYPAPGYTSEIIHVFTVRGLSFKKACPEDDETIQVVIMERKKILKMIREGKIKDGKTIIGILALELLSR